MSPAFPLQLDADATLRALPYAQLVPALARAARELAAGQIHAPERMVVPMTQADVLLAMPAIAADIGITKLITVQPGNPAAGRPAIQGELIAFDTQRGTRLLLADGPAVTQRRTTAITLLAIEHLALQRPRSALLIGTGVQAWSHLQGLSDYLGIQRFWIAGRSLQAAEAFCLRASAHDPALTLTPLRSDDALWADIATDVVVALTTSRAPVIPSTLADRTLAIGVGAFRPDMAELPPALLHQRRLVVDHLHGAMAEAGDLLQAGVVWDQVAELAGVLDAAATTPARPAVFKSVGHAAWDLAAARVLLAAH